MNSSIYIACDNEDQELGHFFQSCHDKIRDVAVANDFQYESLTSQHLTKENINKHTSGAGDYVFAAFSHANDDAFVCGGNTYIGGNDNVKNFYSSIFYSFACYTANGIGKEFEKAYVLGYSGYNNEVTVVPACEEMFVECATRGLVSYIEGKTLEEAVSDLIAEYDRCLSQAKVNLIYASLLKNKQALVTIINAGNKTIND